MTRLYARSLAVVCLVVARVVGSLLWLELPR